MIPDRGRSADSSMAMTMDVASLGGRKIFLCAILLLWGAGAMGSQAQSITSAKSAGAPLRPVPLGALTETVQGGEATLTLRDRSLAGPARTGSTSPSFRFGRALGGSAVGVAAGTGIGLLLWRAAAGEGFSDDQYDRPWRDEPDAASVLFGLGLFAIAAGGPIGAVEGAGLEERRTDAYVVATIGEVVLGGLGCGLVRKLNGGTTGPLVGLGVGAALGAAGGAGLVMAKGTQGAVAYRDGTWRIAPPNVQVRPSFAAGGALSVDVTLVSVRL